MDRQRRLRVEEGHPAETPDEAEAAAHTPVAETEIDRTVNPPRTTTGKMTSPKFGSAGSGGAELEPGPERD